MWGRAPSPVRAERSSATADAKVNLKSQPAVRRSQLLHPSLATAPNAIPTLPSLPNQSVFAQYSSGHTIQPVKAYRIERVKNGMKFTCKQCSHSVTTLDFDAKAGNLRTQAATAINAHATTAHQTPMTVSLPDSQLRSWR